MNTITKEIFAKLFPYANRELIDRYYPFFLLTLNTYQINSTKRIAAFCAQVEEESGSLRYCEEIASGKAYEYRKDLGNLTREALEAAHAQGTTTGRFYKGHGLIQITGYYNHKVCGDALRIDLVNNPKLLCEPEYACKSAGWYWNTHNCNAYADIKDIKRITRIINGGYTHLDKRIRSFERNLSILQGYDTKKY